MVTKDYSKSRMRENCKYGSVRGGQSNLIPSTRLTAAWPLRVVVGGFAARIWTRPAGVRSEHILHYANWICREAKATRKSSESVTAEDEAALAMRKR